MKGPGSARKEAAHPASYRALSSTAQLRAPGATLTLVIEVLGSPAASTADAQGWLRSGRTPTWRADKTSGCHVTWAVAQTRLPPVDLPSSFLLSLPSSYPLFSPPLSSLLSPLSSPSTARPARSSPSTARHNRRTTPPRPGDGAGLDVPPSDERQKFLS